MPSRTPSKKSQRPARASHRSTLSLQKTEILINVYDLLPPGRLSSTLWFLGTSLLHSGVVINGKEYAYGGHDRRGITGVYWTKPKTEPPGGTFKCEILHGFTLASQSEIDSIIRDVSEEFLGTAYNLLTKNCNHFTAHLCQKLTGRPGPGWLNRAASIGVALPCVVPRDWIETPDFENTPDGALLDNTEDDEGELHADERSRMLRSSSEQPHLINPKTNNRQKSGRGGSGRGSARRGGGGRGEDDIQEGEEQDDDDDDAWNSEDERRRGGSGKGKGKATAKRDEAGRTLPASERAPTR